jgi:hypothetical protein
MGLDPALGGGNALTIVHPTPDKLFVVDCRIDYGLSKTEEILDIVKWGAVTYRPSLLVVEIDSQQKGLGNDDRLKAMSQLSGFEVRPHRTQGIKRDEVFEVAAMNQSFIKQEISIPWADENARKRMGPLVEQLRAWRPDIPTKKLRQDAVMSLWFTWRVWMSTRQKRNANREPQWRPSWLVEEGSRRSA